MKTAEERAKELLDKSKFSTSGDRRVAKALIIMAMRDQDKITRHASADAVLEGTAFEKDCSQFDNGIRAAYRAIMNTEVL